MFQPVFLKKIVPETLSLADFIYICWGWEDSNKGNDEAWPNEGGVQREGTGRYCRVVLIGRPHRSSGQGVWEDCEVTGIILFDDPAAHSWMPPRCCAHQLICSLPNKKKTRLTIPELWFFLSLFMFYFLCLNHVFGLLEDMKSIF